MLICFRTRERRSANLSKNVIWNVSELPSRKKQDVRNKCNGKKQNYSVNANDLRPLKILRTLPRGKLSRRGGWRCRGKTSSGRRQGRIM
jgi:hypothetical protein